MSIGLYSRVTDMRFRVAAPVNHGVPLPFSTYGERERNSAKNHLIVTGSRFMAVANSRELVMLKSILVAISFFLVSVAGNADVYVWRSATGVLNYSDTPPPADARDVKILRIPGQKGIGRGTDRAETRQPSPATAGRAGTGSPGSAPGGATTAAASARSSGGAGGAAGGGGAGGAAGGGRAKTKTGGGTTASSGTPTPGGTTTAAASSPTTTSGRTTAAVTTPAPTPAPVVPPVTVSAPAPAPVVPPVTVSAPAPTPVVPPVAVSPPAPAPTPVVPPVAVSPPAPAPTPVVPPVTVSPPAPTPGSANLLFSSGFEGLTALNAPSAFFTTGAWQGIVGADNTTGFTWPPNIWGGGPTRFQMIAMTPIDATTLSNYQVNQIQTVTGHNGTPTQALYSVIKQSGCTGTSPMGSCVDQDAFMLQPPGETSDLYMSYWIKYQPDIVQKMNYPNPNWRVLFEWKTGFNGDDGDYRVAAQLVTWGLGGPLSWHMTGDNVPSSGSYTQGRYWEQYTVTDAQTLGNWMKFEVFWHRSSGADGRVWMAVNGQVILDHYGSNIGVKNAPINRIFMPNLYGSTAFPIYQWVDDLQIWDGFPPVGNNPPYAPH